MTPDRLRQLADEGNIALTEALEDFRVPARLLADAMDYVNAVDAWACGEDREPSWHRGALLLARFAALGEQGT